LPRSFICTITIGSEQRKHEPSTASKRRFSESVYQPRPRHHLAARGGWDVELRDCAARLAAWRRGGHRQAEKTRALRRDRCELCSRERTRTDGLTVCLGALRGRLRGLSVPRLRRRPRSRRGSSGGGSSAATCPRLRSRRRRRGFERRAPRRAPRRARGGHERGSTPSNAGRRARQARRAVCLHPLEVCRLNEDLGYSLPLQLIAFLEEEGSGFGQMLLGTNLH
jgi:hypothetical protein